MRSSRTGFGIVILVSVTLLDACAPAPARRSTAPVATVPEPTQPAQPLSLRRCETENSQAETAYQTTEAGEVLWTVIFDAQTRKSLESHRVRDEDGVEYLELNELDCLLQEQLHEHCPNWTHDQKIAVGLADGRLQAKGSCGAQTPIQATQTH